MDKITLSDILSGFSLTKINDNFSKIQDAINNTVLGKGNDTLQGDLDVNGKRLYNLPAPAEDSHPARLKDVRNAVAGIAAATANLVGFNPQNGIAASNVQGAIEEVGVTKISGVNAISRKASDKLTDVVNVKDFGAKGDGFTDDTAAINNAFLYFTTAFSGGCLVFPKGNYITKSQIVVNDLYFKTVHFEGATICGASTGTSYDAVMRINNAQNVKFTGAVTFTSDSSPFGEVNDPNKYATGLYTRAQPGGAIKNDTGILAYIDLYGLTFTKIPSGLTVGAYDDDAQVAEYNVHGMMTPFCPNPVRIGGSQTVVTFIGGSITSNLWPTITNPVYTTFLIEGGAVSVLGGEITNHGPTAGVVVDFRPAKSSAFSNPYAAFTASGSLVETKWPFARVNNPRALASPVSSMSHITLSGCYGYSGELPTSLGFMSVDDVSYKGKITVDEGCLFYQTEASTPRTAATINCSTAPQTLVSVGRKSFIHGYPHWMAGVAGGRLIHGLEHCIQAYVTSGTLAAGGNRVKPTVLSNDPKFQRYRGMYDSTTGIITIPSSGTVDTMRIEVSLLTGGATGDIYLQDLTNNQIVCFGQNTGTIANLVATVSPTPGQQFALIINSGTNITFSGSVVNNINIYLSAT